MAVALPEDTLYNIFSKIPIKSLARFRCVCKLWSHYINDPHHANIHVVKEEPRLMHHALIKSSNPFQPVSVLSFFGNMEDTTDGIQVKMDLSSIFQVKRSSISNLSDETLVQGYCNGLIALLQQHHLHDLGDTFVVINLLTKEGHALPVLKQPSEIIIGQGLGFDHSTNTFKMVCVFLKKQLFTEVYICTALVHVLGTDSWRQIPQMPLYHILGEAVYANGRLYWFSRTSSWSIGSHLVWFDMKTEEFGVVDLPAKQEEGGFLSDKLIDLNGEVGFVYRNRGSDKKVVWILKHEEWIIHCVLKRPHNNGGVGIIGCWNKDGDILITCPQGLSVYRLKSSSFHRLIGSEELSYNRLIYGSFHTLIGPEFGPGDKGKEEVRMHQSSLLSIHKWHKQLIKFEG